MMDRISHTGKRNIIWDGRNIISRQKEYLQWDVHVQAREISLRVGRISYPGISSRVRGISCPAKGNIIRGMTK